MLFVCCLILVLFFSLGSLSGQQPSVFSSYSNVKLVSFRNTFLYDVIS